MKPNWIALPLILMMGCGRLDSQNLDHGTNKDSGVNAPEFPDGLEWLNTDHPLKLRDLHGKVVLLDFWTYCCINCMHIIPDLKRLEREFPDELVVIGVHSAKFTQEKETSNIRQAILRYEITHPVINDRDFKVWSAYAANAWPTVVLIDPQGRIAAASSGEGVYLKFSGPIQQLIAAYDKRGELDRRPLELKLESAKGSESFLSFPGKVLADATGNRLFISDQNHNRIVICGLNDGSVTGIVGSGELGFADGDYASAMFNHPQGMALVGDTLYLADTENHAVRAIDLAARQVTTLAGNGTQAPGFGSESGRGRSVALSSPWDLAYQDGLLYVAMAGTHQIWTIRTADGYAEPFAGTSREGRQDGNRREAWLAQPSELALAGNRLYFADSEVSSVRYVDLTNGQVVTVVGEDLFEFGDKDGSGDRVRLQHPLGVAWGDGRLYVADTYNSKIKSVDPDARQATTVAGDGTPGLRDGVGKEARFYEPGGISYTAGLLYIADTDNHRIRILDTKTEAVRTMNVEQSEEDVAEVSQELALQRVSPGAGAVKVAIILPSGYKISDNSQVTLTLDDADSIVHSANGRVVAIPADSPAGFAFPVDWVRGRGSFVMEVDYMYCSEGDESVCRRGFSRLHVPVEVASGGGAGAVVLAVKPQ